MGFSGWVKPGFMLSFCRILHSRCQFFAICILNLTPASLEAQRAQRDYFFSFAVERPRC
jgi:hypothetical protein